MVFLIVHLLINPFDRGFYCSDETIRFPYKEDTVPLWVSNNTKISELLFNLGGKSICEKIADKTNLLFTLDLSFFSCKIKYQS